MLFNNNARLILGEFCLDYSRKMYGRQLAKSLKMNQKTAANTLNGLEKEGILKYSTEGKNKYYFLNKHNPKVADVIKIIEIERKNRFIERYPELKELFYALEKKTDGMAIIFGSYANLTANKNSDLDVFIAGKISDTNDLEEAYNIKINVVKSSKENINKNNIFIKEIVKNHIILKGVEEFIGLTWQ